jgi:signal peptidase I
VRVWLRVVFGGLAVVCLGGLLVVTLLFKSFTASSPSMNPTVHRGDKLLVLKTHSASRNDIVVFHAPRKGAGGATVVKRVIGIEGDRLEAIDGHLYRNGLVVHEPWVHDHPTTDLATIRVPKGHVYVLGDQRLNSLDSRTYGPIPRSALVGTVALVGVSVARWLLAGAAVAALGFALTFTGRDRGVGGGRGSSAYSYR